jgi:hypothetical protein
VGRANTQVHMRARRGILAGAVLSATLLSLVPAPAAQTRIVSVFNNYFDEAVTDTAVAGDTITIAFQDGSHNAVAFQGATFNTGNRISGERVSFTFNGDVVRFRCTAHSSLNATASPPICVGMCGVVADHPIDVTPPTVTLSKPVDRSVNVVTPTVTSRGDVLFPMVFEGAASDDFGVYGVRVRVYDGAGVGREYDAVCDYCAGKHVTWKATAAMTPGFYTAEALAADPSGNRAVSKRVQFVVT